MYEVRFYIGMDSDANGDPIPAIDYQPIMRSVISRILETFNGYTLYTTNGGWKNPAGGIVQESGMVLEVIAPGREVSQPRLAGIAQDLEVIARQSCVLYTVKPVTCGGAS